MTTIDDLRGYERIFTEDNNAQKGFIGHKKGDLILYEDLRNAIIRRCVELESKEEYPIDKDRPWETMPDVGIMGARQELMRFFKILQKDIDEYKEKG